MLKAQEIQILRDAIERLGNDSYCGPWLTSVLYEVESDIRSDMMPAATIKATQAECHRMLAAVNEQCRDHKARVDKEAQQLLDVARRECERIHSNCAAALHQALKEMNR